MTETPKKPAPQLGWTKHYKLTVNGQRARLVTWYDGFVSIAAGQEIYHIDTETFDRFVSEHWDSHKTWYYL